MKSDLSSTKWQLFDELAELHQRTAGLGAMLANQTQDVGQYFGVQAQQRIVSGRD